MAKQIEPDREADPNRDREAEPSRPRSEARGGREAQPEPGRCSKNQMEVMPAAKESGGLF